MRRRILVTIVSVTLAAVCAFFVPAALAIRSSTRRGDSLDVERDAAIVASQIPPVGPVDVAQFQHLIGTDRQLGVYDNAVGLVDGVGPRAPDAFTRLALAGQFAEGWSGGNLVAAVPVRSNTTGPPSVVRIEEPASVSRIRIERSLALLALIGAAIVGTAAMIGVLLTRRLARPVERLTKWATHADDEPVPPPTTGITELDELRDALVDERGRVDAALSRERSFSSHVSHQLRTPVAALRAAIETELAAPRPDPTSLLHEGLGAVDRLEATITSLLALARRAEGEPVLCDAAAVVADQVDRWRPTLAAHGRDIGVVGAPLIISIDPATVRHIVDVLIENAFLHGAGMIAVRIERSQTQETGRRDLVIDVSDDGSVLPGADPFTAQPVDSGRGIGLRLARTLAESSGGCLDLQASSPTRFRLRLPERGGVYPTLTSV